MGNLIKFLDMEIGGYMLEDYIVYILCGVFVVVIILMMVLGKSFERKQEKVKLKKKILKKNNISKNVSDLEKEITEPVTNDKLNQIQEPKEDKESVKEEVKEVEAKFDISKPLIPSDKSKMEESIEMDKFVNKIKTEGPQINSKEELIKQINKDQISAVEVNSPLLKPIVLEKPAGDNSLLLDIDNVSQNEVKNNQDLIPRIINEDLEKTNLFAANNSNMPKQNQVNLQNNPTDLEKTNLFVANNSNIAKQNQGNIQNNPIDLEKTNLFVANNSNIAKQNQVNLQNNPIDLEKTNLFMPISNDNSNQNPIEVKNNLDHTNVFVPAIDPLMKKTNNYKQPIINKTDIVNENNQVTPISNVKIITDRSRVVEHHDLYETEDKNVNTQSLELIKKEITDELEEIKQDISKINTTETPKIQKEETTNVKYTKEQLSEINNSIDNIAKAIEEDLNNDNIKLTSFEQEQEDNAIISYDDLVKTQSFKKSDLNSDYIEKIEKLDNIDEVSKETNEDMKFLEELRKLRENI